MTCKTVQVSAVATLLILLALMGLYSSLCTGAYHRIAFPVERTTLRGSYRKQLVAKTVVTEVTIRSVTRQLVNAGAGCQEADSSEDPDDGTSVEQYQADLPPRITQSLAYKSQLKPQLPATLVLGFTRQRMTEMIENVCLSWPGPISAAIYLPLMLGSPDNEAKIEEATAYLTELGARLDALDSCQADLVLASELLVDAELVDLLPLNSLRNIALLHSRTPLVFIGDGDFLVSSSLSQQLETATGFQELYDLAAARSFIVVPAFEVNPLNILEDLSPDAALQRSRQRAVQVARGSKADLLAPAQDGWEFGHFGFWKNYTKGHGPTNYTRWQTSSEPYEAEFKYGYEPWGLALRQKVPLFDERFRGYGMNKVVWSQAMAAAGFKFMVHPDAYMVHQPHPESCAKKVWRRSRAYSTSPAFISIEAEKHCTPEVAAPSLTLSTVSERQALQIKAEITDGTYMPHIAPGHCWQQ